MTSHPRIERLLLAAACLCLVCSASPPAHSQAKPTSGQQEEKCQPTQKLILPNGGVLELPLPPVANREAYGRFLNDVGNEDDRIQWETQEGKENIATRRNYGKEMHLKEDEEQALHVIALNAYHRLTENEKQVHYTFENFQREHKSITPGGDFPPEIRALAQHGTAIIDETIVEFRRELGEETFKKVDEWIFEFEEGGTTMDARDHDGKLILDQDGRPIAVPFLNGIPILCEPTGNSAAAQTPVAQP